MVDILLSSENIDVLGGATTAKVEIGIGDAGERGSHIFVGTGDPNSTQTVLPQTPKTYDMYVNLDPSSIDYLFLYQFLNYDGKFTWVKLSRLIPNTFLENYTGDFVDGKLIYTLPADRVIAFANVGVYTSDNFNVQHTVINQKPVASSVEIGDLLINENSGAYEVEITVNAVEYDIATDTWSAIDREDVRVDFIVNVI